MSDDRRQVIHDAYEVLSWLRGLDGTPYEKTAHSTYVSVERLLRLVTAE